MVFNNLKPLLFMALFFLVILCSVTNSSEIRNRDFTEKEVASMKATKAIIHTQFGDMHVSLYPEVAPNHVNNFIELSKSGFYNGTTFHRVIPNFMIQGGDPNSKGNNRSIHGTGGPGYQVKAEFNSYPHRRGILSMARSAHPDSAGSQFFICVADARFLDKKYTVFGKVDKGMHVADAIVSQKRDKRDNPIARIEMTVKIIDPPKISKDPKDLKPPSAPEKSETKEVPVSKKP
ncbi:peptidyl-prolyl cis-trans isomerase [Candidatus Magnetomorum sp. HK-1]|nr:peptidyl-prolyl cis-trans isomerase [Candidatus Magnetomorum sp. HK-1]